MATVKQIDFIIDLQSQLNLSDADMVSESRLLGIVIPFDGRSAVLRKLTIGDASDVITMLKQMVEWK